MMLLISPHAASLYDSPYIGILASVRRGGRVNILGTKAWAADNECFNGAFEPNQFMRWLELRRQYKMTNRFILAPDVVGDATTTLTRFAEWEPYIHKLDFPIGLALQDNMVPEQVPWKTIEAVFVGGSTNWKLSRTALELCYAAKNHDTWVHIGRVNSLSRIRLFWDIADSFDGTHFDRWHKLNVPIAINYLRQREFQLPLSIRMERSE